MKEDLMDVTVVEGLVVAGMAVMVAGTAVDVIRLDMGAVVAVVGTTHGAVIASVAILEIVEAEAVIVVAEDFEEEVEGDRVEVAMVVASEEEDLVGDETVAVSEADHLEMLNQQNHKLTTRNKCKT